MLEDSICADQAYSQSETLDSQTAPLKNIATPSKIPHVLLVEDNVVALHFIETMSKLAGLNYMSAIDGERALELAKSHHFDLIITDIGLPGISGYEFTYAIRLWEKNIGKKPIPIIGLTAHALREAKKECLQSGMNTMLSKPINLTTIRQLMQQYVNITNDTYAQQPCSLLITEDSKLGHDLPDFEEQLFQLNSFPLLNVTLGVKNIGSHELFKDMLEHMRDVEIPQTLTALEKAHEQKDWESVEKFAHAFKGGAIYCGTMKMQYACQYLERYYKAGYTTALETLYQQLIKVMYSTQDAIQQWLKLN